MNSSGTGKTQISKPDSKSKGTPSPSALSPSPAPTTTVSSSPSNKVNKVTKKFSGRSSQSLGTSPSEGSTSHDTNSGHSLMPVTSPDPSEGMLSPSMAGNSTASGRFPSQALPPTPQKAIAGSGSSPVGVSPAATTNSGSGAMISGAASHASGAMAAKPSRPGATLGTRFGWRGVMMRWDAVCSSLGRSFFISLKSFRLRSS